MLVVDLKKSVPLNPARLDWNYNRITIQEVNGGYIVTVPLLDEQVQEAAKQLAYDVAETQPWLWHDHDKITVSLIADITRLSPRFSLQVGVQPASMPDGETPPEWVECEERRRAAIRQYEQNGGGEVFDTFPVMLTPREESAVMGSLFDKLGIY